MRRKRWLGVAFVVLSMTAAACGSGDDDGTVSGGGGQSTETTVSRPTFAAGTTMANLQSKGKIVIGTKFNQLGSGLKNPTNGQLEGFDIEIGKLIGVGLFGGTVDSLGSKVEFKEAVSAVREAVIQSGDVDIVIATYTITPNRKLQVDFAGPYVNENQDIMVKTDNTTIKTIADLNGKKVCTGEGSTTPANLTAKQVTADLTLFKTYPECAEALRQGRVEAVVTDRGILLGLVDGGQRAFKVVGVSLSDEPLGIGLKKGDDAFRAFLNDRLDAIIASGEWKAAYEKTLGKLGIPTPTPPKPDRYAGTGTATTLAATTTTVPATTSTTR